jgi:hypothetical protein
MDERVYIKTSDQRIAEMRDPQQWPKVQARYAKAYEAWCAADRTMLLVGALQTTKAWSRHAVQATLRTMHHYAEAAGDAPTADKIAWVIDNLPIDV